jgi:hypothetical protein
MSVAVAVQYPDVISKRWGGVFNNGVELLTQPTTEGTAHRPILAVRRRPFKRRPAYPPVKTATVIASLAEATGIHAQEQQGEQ